VDCTYSDFYRLRNLVHKRYRFYRVSDDEWVVRLTDGSLVLGDKRILTVLAEPLEKNYHVFDYLDKTVLDVGGFMGETAVLFTSWGAGRVVVYEPVPENARWVKLNTAMNKIDAEVHNEGIGEKDGEVIVKYGNIDPAFGLPNQGKKTLKIKVKNASDLIQGSHADIAKIDCEGGEIHLLKVANKILCSIPSWIIECHDEKVAKSMLKKFKDAGFDGKGKRSSRNSVFLLIFRLNQKTVTSE
jgi:FkbM family methyltransferase